MKQRIVILIFLIILSFPSIFGLIRQGFFQSDDGEWMVIRFSAFHQALRDGQFPVRFLPRLNYDYGYPVANFLYPGFMYLGEPIHLMGFGFVDTIKIILGISMLASLVFCYLWLSKFFNKVPSLVGSLFYLYAPYHLFDIYTRGSVGEILALAIIPFILWQIEQRFVLWSSIGVGFLIVSHNTLAFLFLPIIIGYILIKKSSLLPIVFGIGLSAFFWVPALYDLRYTIFSYTKVSDPKQYFASLDLVGYLLVFLFLIGIGSIVIRQKIVKKQPMFHTMLFFLSIGILSIILSTLVSKPLWTFLPISFIQFPFRLLSIEILSVSFIVAFLLNISKKGQLLASGILSILLFILSYQYLMPKVFFDKEEGFYTTNQATTTVQNEYMPKWVKIFPSHRKERKVEIESGQISQLHIKSNRITFTAISEKDTIVKINNVFFPGWNVSVDDRETPLSQNNDKGIMEIHMLPGNHVIKAWFIETPVRLLSDAISLMILFVVTLKQLNIIRLRKRNV